MIMCMAHFTPDRVFDLARQAELARERRVQIIRLGGCWCRAFLVFHACAGISLARSPHYIARL
jgi:hypothetical protein